MEELNNRSLKYDPTSNDGQQIIWTANTHLNTHMKSEPLERQEQLKRRPRLKQKKQYTSKFN